MYRDLTLRSDRYIKLCSRRVLRGVNLKSSLLILVVLELLITLSVVLYFYQGGPTPSTTTTLHTTQTTTMLVSTPLTTSTLFQPVITGVVSEGFVFLDGELYWRIRIYGEVDVRERVNISGVYDWWVGRSDEVLPSGESTSIFEPPDYSTIAETFRYISGSTIRDAYIPTEWFEEPCLEGEYRVGIWLQGPYDNKTILFNKTFEFKMLFNTSITPTTWSSWSEKPSNHYCQHGRPALDTKR